MHIVCPNCGGRMEVDQDYTGAKVECYHCSAKFVVDRVYQDTPVPTSPPIPTPRPSPARSGKTRPKTRPKTRARNTTSEASSVASRPSSIPAAQTRKKKGVPALFLLLAFLLLAGGAVGLFFLFAKKSGGAGEGVASESFPASSQSTPSVGGAPASSALSKIAGATSESNKTRLFFSKFAFACCDDHDRLPSDAPSVASGESVSRPSRFSFIGGGEIDKNNGDFVFSESGAQFSLLLKVSAKRKYQLKLVYAAASDSTVFLNVNGEPKATIIPKTSKASPPDAAVSEGDLGKYYAVAELGVYTLDGPTDIRMFFDKASSGRVRSVVIEPAR